MKQNRTVVITGGIGSGKSAALKILSENYKVFSSDKIARDVIDLPEIKKAVSEKLTDRFFGENGLDRKAFAKWVFENEKRTEILNSITHPVIYEKLKKLAEQEEGIVFVEIPLYFETGANFPCDAVWVITADIETRISRVRERDKISREEILDRIKRQVQIENVNTAYTEIENNGSVEDLRKAIGQALKEFQE